MLPYLKNRVRWAVNSLFASGSLVGSPTKVPMSNADLADGARPDEQAAAEWENYWRNDIDVTVEALRRFQFNLTGIQGPLATTVTSVARKNGIILAVLASPGFYRCYDSTTEVPLVISYGGEGAALPKFDVIGQADVGSNGFWLSVGHYAGAPTATAFGVWSVNPDVPSISAPTITPFLGLGPYAAPTTPVTHRLVLAKGGKAYTFDGNGSVNFAEIDDASTQAWTNRLGVVGMRPGATSVVAGARINGADVLCCVESSTGVSGGAIRATVEKHDASSSATTTTLSTVDAVDVCWVGDLGQFVYLDLQGKTFTIDPVTAAVVNIGAPTMPSNLASAKISEMGWLGRCADGKTVLYSTDFLTIKRLPALASTAIMFDGECWWIADSGAAFTYSRTQAAP